MTAHIADARLAEPDAGHRTWGRPKSRCAILTTRAVLQGRCCVAMTHI
jgi:hypothetical protein